jgi:hypothetical protein
MYERRFQRNPVCTVSVPVLDRFRSGSLTPSGGRYSHAFKAALRVWSFFAWPGKRDYEGTSGPARRAGRWVREPPGAELATPTAASTETLLRKPRGAGLGCGVGEVHVVSQMPFCVSSKSSLSFDHLRGRIFS